MLHNNRSRRPEPEAPPPSSVQDYLARKYAALGIDPPEPNGHQSGIPETLTDERCEAAPKPSASEQRSDLANKPCDERSNVAHLPPDPGSRTPDPAPTAAPPKVAPKPLTRDQRTALDLLERGKTVTDIMDTLGFQRRTFYDWRDANPTFAAAVQRSRDERRGVIVDAVEDIQLAGLTLIDNYIRSDHASDSIRLRAVSLIFRYGNTENVLPRRLVANLTGPDGLTPISQNPQAGPTAPAPSGQPSDTADTTGGQPSDAAPNPAEPRNDLAHTTPESESLEPETASTPAPPVASNPDPVSTATATAHTQETAESVRCVRFENPQSTSATPDTPSSAPLRTQSGSAGIPPNPEHERRASAGTLVPPAPTAEGANTNDASPSGDKRSDAAANPSEQRSDLAPSQGEQRSDLAHTPPEAGIRNPEADAASSSPAAAKPKRRETILADAYLAATFLHKHEPREAFERLFKHQIRAYAPATPQEELLTFRIAQKSWILRRLDTLERVIADSAVNKVRAKHPNAAPAACIAMTYLQRNDTDETRFYERIAAQRKDHEAALDRLESKLQTLQNRREAREDRREARHEAREDRHRKPAQTMALPATPKALQRAAA